METASEACRFLRGRADSRPEGLPRAGSNRDGILRRWTGRESKRKRSRAPPSPRPIEPRAIQRSRDASETLRRRAGKRTSVAAQRKAVGLDHEHADCGHEDMVWLPPSSMEVEQRPLARKSFCLKCGLVRNVGSDRARPIGFWTAAIIRIRESLEREHRRSPQAIAKLPAAQLRLILRQMIATPGFDDPYAMTRTAQVELVWRAIQKYRPDVPVAVVEDALLDAAPPKKKGKGTERRLRATALDGESRV